MKRKKFQKKYIGNGGCRMKKRRIFSNLNDKEFAWVLYDYDCGCAAWSGVRGDFGS